MIRDTDQMTPNDLYNFLYIRKLFLCEKVEDILKDCGNEDLDTIQYLLGYAYYMFSLDDYLFYNSSSLDKFYDIVSQYRSNHRDSESTQLCNEAIFFFNNHSPKISPKEKDYQREYYYRKQMDQRGLTKNYSDIPRSTFESLSAVDFGTFRLLHSCILGYFSDKNPRVCSEDSIEILRETPLRELQLGGQSQKETFDCITDPLFLISINYLLVIGKDVFENDPRYLDVMEILVKKAFQTPKNTSVEEKKSLNKPRSEEEKFIYKLQKRYNFLSYYTQKSIKQFRRQTFDEKQNSLFFQKVKQLVLPSAKKDCRNSD